MVKYGTDVFSTDRANMERAEVRVEKRRYDISLVQTEKARSISNLLCDQKSCECSVKTQQGVSLPPNTLRNPNQNDRRFPIFKIIFVLLESYNLR